MENILQEIHTEQSVFLDSCTLQYLKLLGFFMAFLIINYFKITRYASKASARKVPRVERLQLLFNEEQLNCRYNYRGVNSKSAA